VVIELTYNVQLASVSSSINVTHDFGSKFPVCFQWFDKLYVYTEVEQTVNNMYIVLNIILIQTLKYNIPTQSIIM